MDATLPTVFLIDDDASIRRSLTRLVRQAGWEAKAFASAEDCLQAITVPPRHPACMVVDLQMPGLSGLEFQNELARRSLGCPVIFISGNGDIPSTVQAMQQGAVTFLTKPFDPGNLLQAIAGALEQHRASLAGEAKKRGLAQRLDHLTDREREVLSWVITGALNKQIAAELDIVEHTVKVHRARALEKMQVVSVAELVRLCDAIGFAPAVPPGGAALNPGAYDTKVQ
jgi:FixJ family two-component response regulator